MGDETETKVVKRGRGSQEDCRKEALSCCKGRRASGAKKGLGRPSKAAADNPAKGKKKAEEEDAGNDATNGDTDDDKSE